MPQTHYPQFCALARAAEIVGERWTLLIVRELLLGPKRFSDLVERLSGVSPTVLTGRLNALVESGVVRRATLPAPFNAQAYELTPVGLALKPAIRELIRWGGHFLFPLRPDDTFEPNSVLLGLDAIARQTPTPARSDRAACDPWQQVRQLPGARWPAGHDAQPWRRPGQRDDRDALRHAVAHSLDPAAARAGDDGKAGAR